MPPGSNFDFATAVGRQAFLDVYMDRLKSERVEVIALADHNTAEWIDDAKVAGARHGIVVFPGVEVTTQTGSDGVHLVVIGDLSKGSEDFKRLLYGPLGFSELSPTHNPRGEPAPSPQTVTQILEALPDAYLVIAPHALSENGVASRSTAQGEIRWKAIHHKRLNAMDVGDCSNPTGAGWNDRFRARSLNDFPRLRTMAFISTSDAYELEELGKKFTWIRMGEPSVEALRQAFLDHESRVLAYWSPQLAEMHQRNPNSIRHAWITEVRLGGVLGNSEESLEIGFHPGLNVIIGGRGSGKSTIVAAIRELYSTTKSLPERLRDEADAFVKSVFSSAWLEAKHKLQESQQDQAVSWRFGEGSFTGSGNERSITTFPVTVINQKELFERAAGSKSDPYLSSRSLLAYVDGRLGFDVEKLNVIGFTREQEDARANWTSRARELQRGLEDVAKLGALKRQRVIVQSQVDAFAAPEVRQRLAKIETRSREANALDALYEKALTHIREVGELASNISSFPPRQVSSDIESYQPLVNALDTIVNDIADSLTDAANLANHAMQEFEFARASSEWSSLYNESRRDFSLYVEELAAKGLSTSEFGKFKEELETLDKAIERLQQREREIDGLREKVVEAWDRVMDVPHRRRDARRWIFNIVGSSSGRLRFETQPHADTIPWISTFREVAGLRIDAFVDDVSALADWIWGQDSSREARSLLFRNGLASADLTELKGHYKIKSAFADRLVGLDEAIRFRLASLLPDDVVRMRFLRDNGDPNRDDDWQLVNSGSAGQRTAAMLGFVLHYGNEPLVLDQPEDDLDSDWIARFVVQELRRSRSRRQIVIATHNANIPVLGDADHVISLENLGKVLAVRSTTLNSFEGPFKAYHVGPIENSLVRSDIQSIMEGGVAAFVQRETKYRNETAAYLNSWP